jgi:DNA-binding MarR family transcriptional regulator
LPGYLIRRLQQAAVSIFVEEATTKGFDLTPVQYAALYSISANPGLDQAWLAGLIALDRTTVGGIIDRLEAKGFVRRCASDRDRRIRQLFATPTGSDVLSRIPDTISVIQARILAPLTSLEQQTFLSLVEKLVEANNEQVRVPHRPTKAASPRSPTTGSKRVAG